MGDYLRFDVQQNPLREILILDLTLFGLNGLEVIHYLSAEEFKPNFGISVWVKDVLIKNQLALPCISKTRLSAEYLVNKDNLAPSLFDLIKTAETSEKKTGNQFDQFLWVVSYPNKGKRVLIDKI